MRRGRKAVRIMNRRRAGTLLDPRMLVRMKMVVGRDNRSGTMDMDRANRG